MSSTNRSNARNQHIADYYITPQWAIQDFLNEFQHINSNKNIKILDCCAGGDLQHEMSYPIVLKQYDYKYIDTIDIRQDSLADIKTNYLTYNCKNQYDMIITNPPFNLALEIIQKALNDVKNNGFVVMLLRLNFLEGKNRFDFWQKNMPSYIFVHHKRMSFTNDRKTDSIAYAHYVWIKGQMNKFAKIKVI